MKQQTKEHMGTRYAAQFDNLDVVGHPSLLFSPEFSALMQRALGRGSALTREEVDAVFPGVAWEELSMTLLQDDFDTFAFERAFIGGTAAAPVPVAVVSGVACNIETAPAPLRDGLAFCQPLDPDLARDWPVSVLIEKDGHEDRRWSMTAHPGIVAAARRFAGPAARGEARPGLEL